MQVEMDRNRMSGKQIKYLFGRLLVAASAIKARAIIPIITS